MSNPSYPTIYEDLTFRLSVALRNQSVIRAQSTALDELVSDLREKLSAIKPDRWI